MRLRSLIPALVILCASTSVFAQDWIEDASRADFFSVNFPGQPKVPDGSAEGARREAGVGPYTNATKTT